VSSRRLQHVYSANHSHVTSVPRILRRYGSLWVALLCIATAFSAGSKAQAPAHPPQSGILSIRQLDVGQGDAALITTPEGRHILIDAGPTAGAVADLLWKDGFDTLDLVISSHNHADHIAGMSEVFFSYVVRAYMENGIPSPTAVYRRTLAAVEKEQALKYLEASDRTVTVGSVTLRILPPTRLDNSQNNNSVGVLLEYGRFRALYTGDSERLELAEWLREGRITRVSLVKVAHHGSVNGTTADWIRATSPAIAVISVGAGNRYGHPSPDVERAWRSVQAVVYRTDRDGEVEITATADGRFAVHTRLAAAAARIP